MDIIKRAAEIVADRLWDYYERERTHMAEAYKPAPDELRAAYQAVIASPDFSSAVTGFVEQYGQEQWDRQVALALGRLRR